MVLPYNPNVPQGPQIIAQTQAPILQNFQSIGSAFNEAGGNNFTKVQMQAPLVTDPVTAVNSGVVFLKTSNTTTELFYERDQGTAGAPAIPLVHLSMIKAWGSFDGTQPIGIIPATNKFNVTSINKIVSGRYTVTLVANSVISSNFGVLVSCSFIPISLPAITNYSNITFLAGVATFDIFCNRTNATQGDPNPVSFMVFQL